MPTEDSKTNFGGSVDNFSGTFGDEGPESSGLKFSKDGTVTRWHLDLSQECSYAVIETRGSLSDDNIPTEGSKIQLSVTSGDAMDQGDSYTATMTEDGLQLDDGTLFEYHVDYKALYNEMRARSATNGDHTPHN